MNEPWEPDYIEFAVVDEERYAMLAATAQALAAAKSRWEDAAAYDADEDEDDVIHDWPEDEWRPYFDAEALSHFADRSAWTAAQWDEYNRRAREGKSTPGDDTWDFGSWLDAIREGDYELIGCSRVDAVHARLRYRPRGWPYGSHDALRTLVEAFGHRIVRTSED